MKLKLICLLVAAALALVTLAACQPSAPAASSEEPAPAESSAEPAAQSSEEPAKTSDQPSEPAASEPEPTVESSEEPVIESSEEPQPDDSSVETSDNPGEESKTGENVIPEFISNYISFKAANTQSRATDAASVRLTAVNEEPGYGGVILYTYEYGSKIPGSALKDYTVFAYEYNPDHFVYEYAKTYEGTMPKSVSIPDDGFLVAAHKDQTEMLQKLKDADTSSPVFVHGVQPCQDLRFTVKKASGIEIDGVFSDAEWKSYKVEDVDSGNTNWSYAQFDKDNYYATATYYEAYDSDYLYLCVVVSSPFHYCPVTQDNANGMWQYECIQVKVSSESPDGAYILEHYDHVVDAAANNDGIVRAYGFAVNDEGETCYYENSPVNKVFGGKAACSRDDDRQLTVYEVAIPFAEYGLEAKKGAKLGLTFSINSTNADDIAKGVWKNITYRDGGGVIGRNDWAKIPVVTLG